MEIKQQRLKKNSFELAAWQNNHYACGIDEVGRGCLAGPLVVAAAVIPQHTTYSLLKDSKAMTEDERNKAFAWITKNCWYATTTVSHHIIDTINIYKATQYAMRKAFMQLVETIPFEFNKLTHVLIDAMPLVVDPAYTHQDLAFYHFIKGESKSSSIAAASIVAKVTRDRLMEKMGPYFPSLALEQHKGYGTKQHIDFLLSNGPTIIHRSSFITEIRPHKERKNHDEQQLLF